MTTLRISLDELIASIPVVLGSTPRECVVALSINADGLPTCALMVARAVLLDPSSASVTAAAIAEDFASERAQFALLVSYTEDEVRQGCPALEALALEVEYAVPRVELVAVKDERWFRPGCMEADCCPPEGRPMVAIPEGLPAILVRARERAAVNSMASRAALDAAVRRWDERAAAADAWGRSLAEGAVADAATARRLAAALDDLCVRDFVVLTILGAELEAARDALEGIESGSVGYALDAALVGRAAPDPLATERARVVVERVVRAARGRRRKAAAHTLAAVVEWWEGNLGAAKVRCEEALASASDYRLAVLVGIAAARGIGPGWMRKVGQTAQ